MSLTSLPAFCHQSHTLPNPHAGNAWAGLFETVHYCGIVKESSFPEEDERSQDV